LEKAINTHDKITNVENRPSNSEAMHMSMTPDAMEKVGIMKILAEQYITDGQIQKGIDTALAAVVMQKAFFHNMINDQVQETILLLAEAYTVNGDTDEALEQYSLILDERQGNFTH